MTKEWYTKVANSMVPGTIKMFLSIPGHRSFRQVYSNNDQGRVKPSGTFLVIRFLLYGLVILVTKPNALIFLSKPGYRTNKTNKQT